MATLIHTLQEILNSKNLLLAVETKRTILKDVIQAYVLDYLYNHPVYRHLNFYGGTCLHVIYGLNRLSEDLDFDNSFGMELDQLAVDLSHHFQKHYAYTQASAKIQQGEGGIFRVTLKFPVLYELGLSPRPAEALHMKIEISHHRQIAIIQHTPVLVYGRSLVAAHFSLETMMAGKMLACLERNFERGRSGVNIKGRDFYDLLWFMQQRIQPLSEKLAHDGKQSYNTKSAMLALQEKISHIKTHDLAIDLLPMFESRSFIEAWLESFHENFIIMMQGYLET
jgi:predicted nucleotidyltransferase component of viral defense system